MKTFIRSFSCLIFLFYLSNLCYANIYVKFAGGVPTPGNSLADGREDWIEISSFSAGIETLVVLGTSGGGREISAPVFNALKISKVVDSASIGLMSTSVSGLAYSEVIIEVTNTGAGVVEDVLLRIEMKAVFVEKVAMNHEDGDLDVKEAVVLKYEAHRITTFVIDHKTGSSSVSGVHQWDVVRRTPTY